MFRTYVYRLYPSSAQAVLLDQTIEACRRLYNDCLAERKSAYEEEGRSVGRAEQERAVKHRKRADPRATLIHSHILHVVVADVDKAFEAFFRRVKAGEKPGYPRFKSITRFNSFGLKELGNGFRIDGRRLKVSGIGRICVRWHRPIQGTIKTLRIIRRPDGWYAHFSCEMAACPPLAATGRMAGVDVGLASLYTTSDGAKVAHPAYYRRGQAKLRRLQRSVARKCKGSAGRRKALIRVQRHHQTVVRQRRDFLNKVAHGLVQEYDLIALENLRIRNMVRNRSFAKSILDAGWGYFADRLVCKAEEAGRQVVFVDPRNSSRTCSECGRTFEGLTLSVRHVSCPCGLSMDRDENAARNHLKRAGRALWAPSTPAGAFAHESRASLPESVT